MLSLFTAGCFEQEQSIQPFYSKDYVVQVPEASGAWDVIEENSQVKGEHEPVTWFIEEKNLDIYEESGNISQLGIVFFKIGGQLFADITAGAMNNDTIGFEWARHVLPTHSLHKVTIENNRIILADINKEWLNDALKEKKVHLAYVEGENLPEVFTASSADWISFLKEQKDNQDLFSKDAVVLKKNITKNEFFKFYTAWQAFIEQPEIKISSRPNDYILNEPYQAMIQLGRPELPLLIAKIKEGNLTFWRESQFFLWYAVRSITGVDLESKKTLELSEQEMARKYADWWEEELRKNMENQEEQR